MLSDMRTFQRFTATPSAIAWRNLTCTATRVGRTEERREKLITIWMKKMFVDSECETIDKVIKKATNLTESAYYYLKGTINEIENVSLPYYEACDHCLKAGTKMSNGLACLNCLKLQVQIVPKLSILLDDGTNIARITISEEVVEALIRYPVEDYKKINNQGARSFETVLELAAALNSRKRFSESEVRIWCFQVFEGLEHMHQRGYFHRDLKPENLLAPKDLIKIADLGMTREIDSHPLFTDYVTTRWRVAAVFLLGSPTYGPLVDMWAMGAIMAELFTIRALFPGSSEADELHKISCVIGSPTKNEWPEGLELAKAMNYNFPQISGVHLSASMPGVSKDAIDLIKSLCSWDPSKRPAAIKALRHPFFQSCCSFVRPFLSYSDVLQTSPHSGIEDHHIIMV
ncbi:cyclin-dependent kinase F-4-like [Primulina eburnea]|uniref:cyclin-dependent kinase F-4-like n=1 Tax=Primulina eburnea TaxID=1245227 RepID=UPI003C6C6A31